MNRIELKEGWERLRKIYSSMPEANRDVVEEWFQVLQNFTGDELDTAITAWIRNEKYRPVPSELMRYCWNARKEMATERRRNNPACVCPLCGGSGWVGQLARLMDMKSGAKADVMFPCECNASRMPDIGRKILADARNDSRWYFDEHQHAFIRRTEWIGRRDETLATAEEQTDFWQETMNRFCS